MFLVFLAPFVLILWIIQLQVTQYGTDGKYILFERFEFMKNIADLETRWNTLAKHVGKEGPIFIPISMFMLWCMEKTVQQALGIEKLWLFMPFVWMSAVGIVGYVDLICSSLFRCVAWMVASFQSMDGRLRYEMAT
jgi:hypothetical protein